MTFPLIERVRRLAEKATVGKWHKAYCSDEYGYSIVAPNAKELIAREVASYVSDDDAAFIAAMRTDAPALADVAEQALKALPPPDKLELLAAWFEKFDDDRNITDQPEVQNDLYAWAAEIRRVLALAEKE